MRYPGEANDRLDEEGISDRRELQSGEELPIHVHCGSILEAVAEDSFRHSAVEEGES